MSLDSPLVRQARALAEEAHAGQVRKAGAIPYFVHLEAVAHILHAHGYHDDIVLASAYLHDLLEDRPEHAERMRATMPPEVIETVEHLTEVKVDERGEKRPKGARFDDYVAGLAAGTEAALRAIPVSCADKIHNTGSLVASEQARQNLLLRLSTRPGEHAEQLERLRAVYAPVVVPALLASFDAAARELAETIRAWLPGRAVAIAAEAHLSQYDKAGVPYVYHPLRLMMRAVDDESKMAAVLHDVIEDGKEWSLEELAREGFSRRVVRAVDHLTIRKGRETYSEFIERVAQDRLATRVKLLDLEDNADLSRLGEVTGEDLERAEKYRRAIERLRLELAKRSLVIALDEPSREAVRALAVHREVRGDHVTLAHRVDPDSFDPAWVPGGAPLGGSVTMRAMGHAKNDRVQALAVEIAGARARPYDGGPLHVTVSFAPDARASESNALLASCDPEPVELDLRGTLRWVD